MGHISQEHFVVDLMYQKEATLPEYLKESPIIE